MKIFGDTTTIQADVLVVGGGVAGCLAALSAREAGADVLVCDKGGRLAWSGSVGGGVDQFLAVLDTEEEWDHPSYLMQSVGQLTDGLVDLPVVERMVYELPRVFRKIEATGVKFRDKTTGKYLRHRAFGLPGAYHVDFDGKKFKQTIARGVRRAGVRDLTRCAIVKIFVQEGRFAGAVGLNIRTGEVYAFEAKVCVLATGDINRISHNVAKMPFATWHCPYNTGDAQAMGLDVGGILANMEFIEATLSPLGFSSQGTNALTGLGAHYLNASGERFMFNYDALGERARRSVLVDAVINETLEGRAPIYLDVRHLPADELANIERTLEIDRHTVPSFLRQKGVSLREEPVEISVSEFSIRRSGVYFRGSGIVIDESCSIGVEGIFAAGDCCTVSAGIAGASALGYIAGVKAAAKVAGIRHAAPVLEQAVALVRERMELCAQAGDGIRYQSFEDEIRDAVTSFVGFRRSSEGLAIARRKLQELKSCERDLVASSAHETSRVFESRNIRLMAEAMTVAAEERRESRSGSSHNRVDYPQSEESWLKVIGVGVSGSELVTSEGPAEGPWSRLWS